MKAGFFGTFGVAALIVSGISRMASAQTITDGEGNVYTTVTIGTQKWMKENLKATKYLNGDPIGTTTPTSLDIKTETMPKFQWPPLGKDSLVAEYGRLYTWKAATDGRNVCPAEWHVPSNEEWKTLITYLGGPTVAGKALKESGNTHWTDSAGDNSSGFTALPVSIREPNGTVYPASGCWWSSTFFFDTYAYYQRVNTNNGKASNDLGNAVNAGVSVRCLFGAPPTGIGGNRYRPTFKTSPDLGSGRFILESEYGPRNWLGLRIFGISGKVVRSVSVTNRSAFLELNLSDLSKGAYFLADTDATSSSIRKIVIQ